MEYIKSLNQANENNHAISFILISYIQVYSDGSRRCPVGTCAAPPPVELSIRVSWLMKVRVTVTKMNHVFHLGRAVEARGLLHGHHVISLSHSPGDRGGARGVEFQQGGGGRET